MYVVMYYLRRALDPNTKPNNEGMTGAQLLRTAVPRLAQILNGDHSLAQLIFNRLREETKKVNPNPNPNPNPNLNPNPDPNPNPNPNPNLTHGDPG